MMVFQFINNSEELNNSYVSEKVKFDMIFRMICNKKASEIRAAFKLEIYILDVEIETEWYDMGNGE